MLIDRPVRKSREQFRRDFARKHGLRAIAEVTAEWNRRSGRPPITRGRVLQVLKEAEAKLAAALVREVLGGPASMKQES